MPRRPYRTLDDLEVEDLGVFEYLEDDTRRFVPAPPAAPPPGGRRDAAMGSRLRVELPMLWVWIFLSCYFHEGGAWLLWGTGLIALNTWLRPAYERYDLGWLFKIYIGAGLGQVVFGLGQWVDLATIRPLLGFYAIALMMTWIVLELRHQARQPQDTAHDMYDQVYYS